MFDNQFEFQEKLQKSSKLTRLQTLTEQRSKINSIAMLFSYMSYAFDRFWMKVC